MRAETAAVLAAAVILTVLLMVKPIIGMADNGDFLRIMGTVGLDYADPGMDYKDKYFGYFINGFGFKALGLGGYVSTSLIPVIMARFASWVLTLGSRFDMRVLGAIYGGLFLSGAWMTVKYNKRGPALANGLLAALFVLVFADVGYTAYYNSLFSEPVSLVFLLLALGFAAKLTWQEQPSFGALTGFFVSALFLIGAKVQNAPVGLLLTLLTLRFGSLRNEYVWKKRILWYSAVLFLASVAIYFSVPKEIKIINQYQTVFYGVLKDSPTPEKDLRELGLPDKFAVNAGTNYFEKAPIDQKDRQFAEEYHPRFSHVKVALFYLKHPLRFYHKLERAAENGMTIRPYYLGNYEKSAGKAYGAVSDTFGYWSEFKHHVLPNKLWFIGLVYVLYYVILLLEYMGAGPVWQRIYLEIFMLFGLMGLIQFIVPIIGDGEADLAKHLFGFNVCFDLMLLSSVMWAVYRTLGLFRYNR